MARSKDDNRLTGRIGRYARVGGSMGGMAARFAGERLMGVKRDQSSYARELKDLLGGLKGPVMKVAQLLATIPDALPREFAQELSQLQANAPAMGWTFVKRRMRTELGPDWQSKFQNFSKEAVAAASLGQVHEGLSLEGRHLAIKLQYPNMGSAVEADLNQLSLILNLFRRYDPSIDTSEIRQELGERLREELDYELEGRHLDLYGDMLSEEAHVHVPELLKDLSTNRLLTMTWLEGERLLNFKDAPQDIRNQIAINLFRAWYVPLHRYGIIHGDPHLGNYSVTKGLHINLLDFGCIRKFPARFIGGVVDLYNALREGDEALALHAYESWGFKNISKELMETLNIWASFLYGPLMEDKPRLINVADNPGSYGREQAHKVRMRLKELGPITPPREFVFMDRAAVGLGGVFLHLKAEVNWHRLFHELIDDFDVAALHKRQSKMLTRHGLLVSNSQEKEN
ncbi:MAG: AarF/ABC1/UbiB kinase family protein [Sphingomonadales bacterium]|jgi:predicted unusual protein kinase regulating ubiquinone biosynthesis (AarF/ABC1/UbiB family)